MKGGGGGGGGRAVGGSWEGEGEGGGGARREERKGGCEPGRGRGADLFYLDPWAEPWALRPAQRA